MFCDAQNRHTKSSLLIGSSIKLSKQCQALLNKKSQKCLKHFQNWWRQCFWSGSTLNKKNKSEARRVCGTDIEQSRFYPTIALFPLHKEAFYL